MVKTYIEDKTEFDAQTNEPTNNQRATWGKKGLDAFTKAVGDDEPETNISDLICDLMHVADAYATPIDFDAAVRLAKENYEIEIDESTKADHFLKEKK